MYPIVPNKLTTKCFYNLHPIRFWKIFNFIFCKKKHEHNYTIKIFHSLQNAHKELKKAVIWCPYFIKDSVYFFSPVMVIENFCRFLFLQAMKYEYVLSTKLSTNSSRDSHTKYAILSTVEAKFRKPTFQYIIFFSRFKNKHLCKIWQHWI